MTPSTQSSLFPPPWRNRAQSPFLSITTIFFCATLPIKKTIAFCVVFNAFRNHLRMVQMLNANGASRVRVHHRRLSSRQLLKLRITPNLFKAES